MNASQQSKRALIADQAGDWVVAHEAGTLSVAERRAFYDWLTASPAHIEEYLAVAMISRRLPVAADDPAMPLASVIERLRNESDNVASIRGPVAPPQELARPRPLRLLAVAAAAAFIGLGVLWWNVSRVSSQEYATHHGELKTWRLNDGSLLTLNTDSSATVRFGRSERRIDLNRGEALFEVVHGTTPFRVVAGSASILALGTQFSVYREADAIRVTVVRGRVAVSSLATPGGSVTAVAGTQVRVRNDQPPDSATPVDIERSMEWLRRQIVFERQPLA